MSAVDRGVYSIGIEEFNRRVVHIQSELNQRNLDALLVYGDETEPQDVRYLADCWPAFEKAAVLIPAQGKPVLIVGPESEDFARGWSRIDKIRKVLTFRESSEPEYPEIPTRTLEDIFTEVTEGKGVKRLGLVGYTLMSAPVYRVLEEAMGKGKIVRSESGRI